MQARDNTPRARRAPVALVVDEGSSRERRLWLHVGEHSAGCAVDDDVLLDGGLVERTHAVIVVEEDGRVWVRPRSGRIRVNARAVVGGAALDAGSVVEIGSHRITRDEEAMRRPAGEVWISDDDDDQTRALAQLVVSALANGGQLDEELVLAEEDAALRAGAADAVGLGSEGMRVVPSMGGSTGLLSPDLFFRALDREVARTIACERHGSLVVLELDDVEDIEAFAQDGLELVSNAVASLLRKRTRDRDVVGFLGRGRFAVMLPDLDSEAVELVTEVLLELVRDHRFVLHGRPLPVTASIGAAGFSDAGATHTLEIAEAMLAEARYLGGDAAIVAR